MSRSIVKFPDKLPEVESHPYMISKTYAIQVITPIFGGGIKAGDK